MKSLTFLLDWIKNNAGKSFLSLIGVVTAIISFIRLIKGDVFLGLTILGCVILASLLTTCLYVAFHKVDSPILSGRKLYSYAKYRPYALGGIIMIVAFSLGVLSFQSSRAFIITAFVGTATSTEFPTQTPTPIPTSTTTVTPAPPEVTMLVTVNTSGHCGEIPDKDVLDVGINNNSERTILLTSVALVPDDISADMWLEDLIVEHTYEVMLDSWWNLLMDQKNGTNESAKLEPILVEEIPENKHIIRRDSQERFQIKMALTHPPAFLGGTIHLEIETDSNQKLVSSPLKIFVCTSSEEAELLRPDPAFSLAFHPKGDLLVSGSYSGKIRLWDVNSQDTIGESLVVTDKYPILSLAFSPDGKLLASASRTSNLTIWDVSSWKKLDELLNKGNIEALTGSSFYSSYVVFSPDGAFLASILMLDEGYSNQIVLWDVKNWQPMSAPLFRRNAMITSLVFSPSGKIMAFVDENQDVVIWDVTRRRLIKEFQVDIMVENLAFRSNELLVISSHDEIILWDIASQTESRELLFDTDDSLHNTFWIEESFYNSDGTILFFASISEGKILPWDVINHKQIGEPFYTLTYDGHFASSCEMLDTKYCSLALSPDGNTLAFGLYESSRVGFLSFQDKQP